MIGKDLTHYRILEKLGAGGMGEVYVAEDTKLSRKVALKILPPEMAAHTERRERFEREAKAVAALNHPNIVTIHSVEEAEGVHFITMEWVKGKTLTDLIPKRGLPLNKFLEIAIPLADAVSSAHEKGIIHRDLKPDNLMVNEEGRLKILDFGLAKLKPTPGEEGISELPTQSATQEGRILGTVAYMSPEQAEGKSIDHRSDIFSMGIILYEMATGQRPFRGDTNPSILSSIIKDTPASVTDVNPTVPRDLGRLIKRCLAKNPEDRLQTSKDLRNELRELKQEVESGELVGAKSVAKPSSGRKRALLAVFASAVALTVIGTYLLTRLDREASEAKPIESTLTQVTSQTGEERFPSLSPSGEMIVYAGRDSGNWDIYLQRVGGENAINLTKDCTFGDTQPAFSPDGKQIAFRSERDGGGIFIMGATGESVKRITDFGFNPAWSPDGEQIVVATRSVFWTARSRPSQLWTVTVETGEKQIVTDEDAVQPHWSPQGHRIAFWQFFNVGDDGISNAEISTVPAEGGEVVRVTRDASSDWNPVWSPDGKYIYFSSDRSGTMSLWKVPVEEKSGAALGEPELVSSAVGVQTRHISISGDARKVAYTAFSQIRNLQKIAFDPDTEKFVGEPRWITNDTKRSVFPDLSPDGEWVAFNEGPPGPSISIVRADGTGLRQLMDDSYQHWIPRWSPDGKEIAFYSNRSGSSEVWTINPDGSGLQKRTDTPDESIVHLAWSPDGSQMVYTTNRPEKDNYIFDPNTSWEDQAPRKLPRFDDGLDTMWANSWSPDNRWIVGYARGIGVLLFSLETNEYTQLGDFGIRTVWLSDSRRLLFVHEGKLFLLDKDTGSSREILSFEPDDIHSFGLSKDDRVVFLSRGRGEADIWMLTLNEEEK